MKLKKTLFQSTLAASVLLGTGAVASAACLEFDGVDDYVEFNRPISGDFTIECWFRSAQVAGNETQWWQGMGLVDGEVSGVANDFGLALGNGKVLFGTGNPDTTICSTSLLSDGNWHHVAATRLKTNGTLKLFVDGVLNASGTGSTAELTAPAKMRLGSLATGLNFFQGELDEVRLWTVSRVEAEIAASWNRGLVGNEPGLIAYYPMEEGAGPTTSDASGHGFTGTLFNGVPWDDSENAVGPLAVTKWATWVTESSAQLNGLVNPGVSNLVAWFEWGSTTNYGSATAITNVGSGLLNVPVAAVVTGLSANATYHYRVVGSNSFRVSYGADRTFAISPVTASSDGGIGSLRDVIAKAVAGTIIHLTSTGRITLASELAINKDLTIVGPGAANLAISGNNNSRVFNVANTVTVSISGLTIQDGRSPSGANAGGLGSPGQDGASGGGIYNAGSLTLRECVVTRNTTGTGGTGSAGSNGGSPAGAGGRGGNGGPGGGIYNATSGVLTLVRCTVTGNSTGNGGTGATGGTGGNYTTSAGGDGGTGGGGGDGGTGAGLFSAGVVTTESCTVNANNNGVGGAGGVGGNGGQNNPVLGIHYHWGGRGGNGGVGGVGGSGGAVHGAGEAVLLNCTFSGNQNGLGGPGGKGGNGGDGSTTGRQGGGGNGGQGGSGGSVYNSGRLALFSSTIAYSATGTGGTGGALGSGTGGGGSVGVAGTSGYGGGICCGSSAQAVRIVNTIVALNTRPTNIADDVRGAFASQGHNLVGATEGSTGFGVGSDLVNRPPLLAPLADNGGPTWTHAPWAESPAVNAGDNTYATALSTDQRGLPRVDCTNVDIGAFEYVGCPWLPHPAAQNALYFDGVDDYVQGGLVTLSNSSFTIEAWARRDMLGTPGCILGQGTTNPGGGLLFGFRTNNTFTFAFFTDVLDTTSNYTDTDWHHWAGTYDTNGHVRLIYRDGALVASNTAPANYIGTGPLRIGDAPWGSWPFGGAIDEARVWNVVRTADEIAQNRGRALTGTEPSLVAYFRFDEGSGSTTRDLKATSPANLVGGAAWVTSGAPLYHPMVTTLAADSVRSTTATLRGAVNPAGPNLFTSTWFEYGTSVYFGSRTPSQYLDAGLTSQLVTSGITNLESGTRYYFRLAANNDNANTAGTTYGETLTFDTLVVGSGYPISTRANNGQSTTFPRHIRDSGGNIYLAGLFSGSVTLKDTLQAAGSPTNAFLAELARDGDWRWDVKIPVTNGQAQIKGLALDSRTNVLVAGTFSGTATFGNTNFTAPTNCTRAFIARFEPVITNWTWAILLGAGTTNGANALAVGSDDRLYVAGQLSGTNNFGTNTYGTNVTVTVPAGSDIFVACFNADGRPAWATQAGGTGATDHDAATALALGPSGEIYVTGFFRSQGRFGPSTLTNAGNSDVFVAGLNMTNGLVQWVIRAGGTGEDRGTALAADTEGKIYLVAQLAGAADYNNSTLPELDSSGMNLMVMQLEKQGILSKRAAARAAYADSIALVQPGVVYLEGDFTGLMRYGPTLTTVGSGTNASSDVFLAKLTAGKADDLVWADFKQIGGIGTETRGSVSVDPAGSVVVSGTYAQSLHLGYVEISTPNSQEIFLARLDPDGAYEHNRWEIGQALRPPDDALASVPENRAKGLLSIEVLAAPVELEDSDGGNSFWWNDEEKQLYAVRPVTARIKWRLDENLTNLANVATMVGRCFWPDHPLTNVAGAPVEVQGPGVGRGYSCAGILFNTNGATVLPVTRGADQFQVFQTPTNASGYNVIHYTTQLGAGRSAFEVVYTQPYTNGSAGETLAAIAGKAVIRGEHQDSTGKNGYVLFERSFYDGAAYDRSTRTGPILPVNRNLWNDPYRDLVMVWYRTNKVTGVAWGSDLVRYTVNWPHDDSPLVIASGQGAPVTNQQAQVYHQPDPNLAGFNPNEEHALIVNGQLYALRCDLNDSISPKASEPYVLLKYLGPDATNDWRMQVYQVIAEDETHTFANFTTGVAGSEVQLPAALSWLDLCASFNRIAFGHAQAHQAWNGKIYAKSAGYLQVQYWYPTREEFYFGATNPPVGECVPWMDRYVQAVVTPGGTRSLGEPVLVGYQISWPSDVPGLEFGETLTTSKHGLPDLLNFASARVIYDEGNPYATNHLDALVRIFDPLSERTIQLSKSFTLPAVIATADDRGRRAFTGLPYPLRIRLFYDDRNQRLSFGGWYDPAFGAGEPLLLPNILSPRERDRIKELDGTNTASEFDTQIDRLYDLTRNPNQVDVDRDGNPDQELRAGLITQIRDGYNEILMGPVIPGPVTNFVTWRTNVLSQPVSARVTNVVQEQFGDLRKALTAGLRPGSGYVTVIENDDRQLPDRPIEVRILYVTNSLFQGDLKVLPPTAKNDNPFDERLTLRHSGDFGGEPQNYEFEWYYQPDQNGVSPPFPVLAAGQTNWNGWIRFPTPPSGTNNGANDITLGEGGTMSSLLVLCDNWLLCRYRGFREGVPTEWSDWVGAPGGTGAMLAEGWIKRVIAGLNEFDSRVKDFHQAAAATYASMILQAGQRYEGPIAFNPDPNYLNSLGLIASYETVLDRGRELSIGALPPVNFGPANNALLRAAGKIADLYMLLGNEAYADASDPTIGFTTSSGEYGNLAPSIFCFQNQLDSPLEEELALLRGRDDSGLTVRANPYYNRLIWNFTLGEGEVAYKLTYNISDQNGDGFIDDKDARILYPQGHGDAWGHYLTAITKYYELLRHPDYEWVPRPEAVTVAGSPVQVDYLDERKFAQAAAAKAKTGAEIVNLTYRQKYVENPAGQWQGYKDTQSDRAWGVDEWARRAGAGAYFDWVVANAILPATDPDTNHAGIQKIDRTTVAELAEIPSQYAAIEAQLDTVDRGLNPLGLAVGAMPFDIDPSKVAAGQTHFDQINQRALKTMENALALFDYVNVLSQNLRRNQDSVENFTANVADRERGYKNRLIEIFGYPYAGDIGPAGAYQSGYDGPDIVHYMYVNATDLTGNKTQPGTAFTAYFKPITVDRLARLYLDGPEVPENEVFAVDYPLAPEGSYKFEAPTAWGQRRAPGKAQNALGEMLKARAQLNRALADYDNLIKNIQDEVDLLALYLDMTAAQISLRTAQRVTLVALDVWLLSLESAAQAVKLTASTVEKQTDAVVEGIPKSVGLATDATAPARGAIKVARNFVIKGLEIAGNMGNRKVYDLQQAKELVRDATELGLAVSSAEYERAQKVKAIEQLFREEVPKRIELYTLRDELQRAYDAYLSVVAEGQRLLDERYDFRAKTAADTQEYRYQDMAFRIFQNDALQKYRAQFDLAARYVYLAAKAYDYETCLLGSESGAGSKLLTDIVRQRTLGQLVNGLPVSGRQGLADPLARLGQNFEVYRGQLGFTTPETETGRFSLRSELFRVRPGDLETNVLNGLVSTNQDWHAMLQGCRVPDLWQIPEFRRFCRPFAPESAGPQPGLVIRIPTTVTFGLNYFGWPLGPGDSAYDSSRFATKVRSAGVWFSGYDLAGLSMTPRVYLVPTGSDIMRSPSSYELETREFNVVDQKLPVPFPIGASDLSNPSWIPINDSLSETFGDIRRFSSFRAYHDQGWFDENEATQDTRLIGRSVWNTRWLLIIPGGTFLYDPNRGLDTFIATVGDIKIFFQTYSYSGN